MSWRLDNNRHQSHASLIPMQSTGTNVICQNIFYAFQNTSRSSQPPKHERTIDYIWYDKQWIKSSIDLPHTHTVKEPASCKDILDDLYLHLGQKIWIIVFQGSISCTRRERIWVLQIVWNKSGPCIRSSCPTKICRVQTPTQHSSAITGTVQISLSDLDTWTMAYQLRLILWACTHVTCDYVLQKVGTQSELLNDWLC